METTIARHAILRPSFRARFHARVRAAALIPIVMDLPGLAPAARALSANPTIDEIDVDGVAVAVARPSGPGPFPAWVFVTGAHPLRRKEPVVQRLAEGLARSGYVALVPDLPGLGEGKLTTRTLDAAAGVVEAASARPDVRDGQVALIGASAGASIALLVAAKDELADRISVVVSVAPFADLRKILCLATTRRYEENGQFVGYEVATLLRRVVGLSMAAALEPGTHRDALLTLLGSIDDEDRDPFERLELVEGATAPLIRLLSNPDPDEFDRLYGALPTEVQTTVAQLSPLGVASRIRAPVELVVAPEDPYFPSGEAQALAESLANVRLTVTATLDHTRPMASIGRLAGLRQFEAFVVRGLAAAAN